MPKPKSAMASAEEEHVPKPLLESRVQRMTVAKERNSVAHPPSPATVTASEVK